MAFCRTCGKQVADNAEICMGCGVRPLNGDKHCQGCGVETNPKQELCVKCGVRLKTGGIPIVNLSQVVDKLKQSTDKSVAVAKTFGRMTFVGLGILILFVVLDWLYPAFKSWIMVPLALASVIIMNIRKAEAIGHEKNICNIGFWASVVIIILSAVGFSPRMDISSARNMRASVQKVGHRLSHKDRIIFMRALSVQFRRNGDFDSSDFDSTGGMDLVRRKTAYDIIEDAGK